VVDRTPRWQRAQLIVEKMRKPEIAAAHPDLVLYFLASLLAFSLLIGCAMLISPYFGVSRCVAAIRMSPAAV